MVKRLFVALLISVLFSPLCLVWSQEKGEASKPAVIENKKALPQQLPTQEKEKKDSTEKSAENATPKGGQPKANAEEDVEADKSRRKSEEILPASTKAWISVPDADDLEKQFDATQFGELGKQQALKPFAEHLEAQVRKWINDQNVRLNLKLDDLHGVHSGEICFAGVLPEDDNGKPLAGKHGLVFLMDVSKTEDRARELQTKINAELAKRKAKRTDGNIRGTKYTKWVIENPKLFRQKRFNFQAIVDGWMLVSNNEAVFREVIEKLANPDKVQSVETLAGQKTYQKIVANTNLGEYKAHIRWFVDPFGYIELSQQIKDDEAISKVPRDDVAQQLKNNGFDAFKGIGGHISVNTDEHEILHRTFTVAAKKNAVANERFYDLFDFKSPKKQLKIPNWVAPNSSSMVIGNWEYDNLLRGVGYFYDVWLENEGDFQRFLDDLKKDPQLRLDVRKMVPMLDDQLVVMSSIETPVDSKSERVVLGVPVTGDADFLIESLKRAQPEAKMLNIGGNKVIEVDTTVEPEIEVPFGVDIPEEDDPDQEEEDQPRLQLFEKRYFVIANNWLLVTNNKAYVRKLLAPGNNNLDKAADYQQVNEALAKLTDPQKICWRHFGRLDRSLRINYEMLRKGEMANAQNVLARVLNWLAASRAREKALAEGRDVDPDLIRKQQLDGAKLPADFDKALAPFLGPLGSVMEVEDDGWRITGCFLKKVANKPEAKEKKEDSDD